MDEDTDKDQNSCTEVDLMTNMKSANMNYFTASSKNNYGSGNVNFNQINTPNKLHL